MVDNPTTRALNRRLREVEREIVRQVGDLVQERDLLKETLEKYAANTNGAAPTPVVPERTRVEIGAAGAISGEAQEQVLEVILTAPAGGYNVRRIAQKAHMSKTTAQRAINALLEDDLVIKTTPGVRNVHYAPAGRR
jgi:hypothetical protein